MFERLAKYSVYTAFDGDVSYKRDFTRYSHFTNSLIFKKLENENERINLSRGQNKKEDDSEHAFDNSKAGL